MIQIAVIGLGDIARKAYLPVLSAWEGLNIVLCSRTYASVERFNAQYRFTGGTTDIQDIIRQKPKAAFVLTPSITHFEIAKELLEAGIDVFLEKPATLQSGHTKQLAELADRHGRVLMVGFNRRFAPLHRQARELWGQRTITNAFFSKNRVGVFHPDVLHQYSDDTIHTIDVMRYYCGEGEVVSTVHQVREGRLVAATSTVALERGGFALVTTTLKAGRWGEQYAIHGDETSVVVDAFDKLRYICNGEEKIWAETYASAWKTTLEGRGIVGEIGHFFECLTSREQPETSAWDSVKTQELMEAMVAKG